MNLLRIIFVILTIASIACLVRGLLLKRKNIGFIVMAVIVVIGDILCLALMGVKSAKEAQMVLVPYYIGHAWAVFAVLIMIILIDRYRYFRAGIAISAAACLYQTYLSVSQFFGARIFSFQKRIYFRKAWFVATDTKNTGLLFSYHSYRIMTCLNLAIILIVLIVCIRYSHRVFRLRYYSFVVLQAAYLILEILAVRLSLPIWIPSIFYNLVLVFCLYMTSFFGSNRLREWSLDRFSNDMSDGLILYDRYDDLIHMNEMVRNTLSADLLESFKDKGRLEEWINDVSEVAGGEVIVYKRSNPQDGSRSESSKPEGLPGGELGGRKGTDREYYITANVRQLGRKGSRDSAHQGVIGTLYILHDATDAVIRMKAMEEANAELERASRMKSDFLANMSHEIRTPMNAVLGMAEIAMREEDPGRVRDSLRQIQSSGKNLLGIINDILDYSKIESGKMEIIEEEYRPLRELSEIEKVLATRIGDKSIELFVSLKDSVPCILKGDAMRIRQVIINLANNAIKFTQQGVVLITVSCRRMTDERVYLSFHIKDTGIGIKKEDLGKLFVSFQQVDSKRNRAVEGTGLGLAISRSLVEAMGGRIGVDSEYGKGSDFWFELPQTVVDDTDELVVRNAFDKAAFVLDEADGAAGVEVFLTDAQRLGVMAFSICNVSEYVPTGKKDFLFFREEHYDNEIKAFLDAHPGVTGSVFVGMTSTFTPDRQNLRVMRKPETTMGLVRMLNDEYDDPETDSEKDVFRIDFTAPSARVLVVDDNAINLTIAGGLMSPLKMQVDTADSGQEAIDKVAADNYDIVFMDHMMPGIDGVEATRIIRAKTDEYQPVIVALSANAMEEARRLFKECGMNDFVAKPIDVRILISVIKKWLPPEKIIELDIAEGAGGIPGETRIKIEGLDISGAVHALGSADLYDRIAEEYYRSGGDKLDAIMESYTQEDWTDYTIRVHALKSSSRQIGALELGDMAERLEKAGKAGDVETIKADTGAAMEKYRALLDELREYYPDEEGNDSDKPLIDRAELTTMLEQLESYCDDLDMDGMEEIGDRLKEYSYEEDEAEQIRLLRKAISELDTEECISIARSLRGV